MFILSAAQVDCRGHEGAGLSRLPGIQNRRQLPVLYLRFERCMPSVLMRVGDHHENWLPHVMHDAFRKHWLVLNNGAEAVLARHIFSREYRYYPASPSYRVEIQRLDYRMCLL